MFCEVFSFPSSFYVGTLNLIALNPGPKVIKLFSCSAQLRLKFILIINVKMPTIVGILTFVSMINYRLWRYKLSISMSLGCFGILKSSLNFMLS